MSDTLALEHLYNEVVARFTTDSTQIPNLFGWREVNKHVVNAKTGVAPTNKIVWMPGDVSGDVGKHGPPTNQLVNPRSLATLNEAFTVYFLGFDPSAPENELAQYKITRLLYDTWFRAVYLAAYGTFSVEKLNWDRSKTERQHGSMLVAVCTVQARIPDAAFGSMAPLTVTANVTTHLLSQTDPTVQVT